MDGEEGREMKGWEGRDGGEWGVERKDGRGHSTDRRHF